MVLPSLFKSLERMDRRWLVLLSLAASILILSIFKKFPGPWILRDDDGTWMTIVRQMCDGRRLFVDVVDNKPPGFFLYLWPMCWIHPSSDLTIQWEMFLYWVPIWIGWGAALFLIADAFPLGLFQAVVFGFFSGTWLWTSKLTGYFSTESVAACFALLAIAFLIQRRQGKSEWFTLGIGLCVTAATLCNLKFGAFALLYPHARPSRKAIVRDAMSSLLLTMVVCHLTLGWHLEPYINYFGRNRLTEYAPADFETRISELFGKMLFHPSSGIFSILRVPFFWFSDERAANFSYWLLSAAVVSGIAYGLVKKFPYLIGSLVASVAAILAVGTFFIHTGMQLIPFAVPLAACALSGFKARSRWTAHLLLVFSLLALTYDARNGADFFVAGANPAVIRKGKELAEIFSRNLGGKPWVSILTPRYGVWLSPGLRPSMNAQFHQYCWQMPEWMKKELEGILSSGKTFYVALHPALEDPSCKTSEIVARFRRQCRIFDEQTELNPQEKIEFMVCDRENR